MCRPSMPTTHWPCPISMTRPVAEGGRRKRRLPRNVRRASFFFRGQPRAARHKSPGGDRLPSTFFCRNSCSAGCQTSTPPDAIAFFNCLLSFAGRGRAVSLPVTKPSAAVRSRCMKPSDKSWLSTDAKSSPRTGGSIEANCGTFAVASFTAALTFLRACDSSSEPPSSGWMSRAQEKAGRSMVRVRCSEASESSALVATCQVP
mmetsp:Transcript_21664/g.57965  ORF Transcript_21664/g.57965 Transcript_21664/m.57965 type:complete len:203 (+) Transcript_21664:2-610(+)